MTEKKKSRKAFDPEVRQQQLVSKAYDLAEKQLEEGTASAGVITHFLKMGTKRDELELAKLQKESELVNAKAEQIHQQQTSQELTQMAIDAIKRYSGSSDEN